MNNNCLHQFFTISLLSNKTQKGIRVICAYCGQVRDLWESGRVEIAKQDEPEKKINYDSSTTGLRYEDIPKHS